MRRQCGLCLTGRALRGVGAISSGGEGGVSVSCSATVWAADVCPARLSSTFFSTQFCRPASPFKGGRGAHYAAVTLALVVLLNGGQLGIVPSTAQIDRGVSATASVAPPSRIQYTDEKRLLDTLLATEAYKNLAPEYKAWVAADAVRVLQQLPRRYRQTLVDNSQELVERVQPGVPQQMSYYLGFAAAIEVGAETGWFEVRINPRRRIRIKIWQDLDEMRWEFIEQRVSQLLGTTDGLPEPLALAMGRNKSRRDCTPGSRYAEDLGIKFPKY